MAQQVFSLFLFSLFDACVILQNLTAYISGMGTQRALWLEKLRAVVPEYARSLWTCRSLFSVAGVSTPNLVQLHQPNFKQHFSEGKKERGGEMETGNRLFGLGKSFPEKHKSKWFVAECYRLQCRVPCSCWSSILMCGPIAFCRALSWSLCLK